jgi:hypothetical protein
LFCFVLMELGFELKWSCLQSRCFTTWITPPVQLHRLKWSSLLEKSLTLCFATQVLYAHFLFYLVQY